MSWTIWKFPLALEVEQTVEVPQNAKFLHVAYQDGLPTVWAEVDPDLPREPRTFVIVGTGHRVPETGGPTGKPPAYVGTVLRGAFVWHIYVEEV